MDLAEKYKAEIAKIDGAEVTENDHWFCVSAGPDVRLRVDKPTLIQREVRVQVSWASIGGVTPDEAAIFAAKMAALAGLAGAIEKYGA